MKRIVVLLAIIFYVAVVGGRNLNDDNLEIEDSEDKHDHDDHTNNQRHRLRRRPRQSFYNQFSSYNPYEDINGWNRDDRRDLYSRQQDQLLSGILHELKNNNRRQDQLLSGILYELKEFSSNVKELSNNIKELNKDVKKPQTPPPPQPPQIIYVPFPYPVLQFPNQTNPFIPCLNDRAPSLKDKNQNWGLIPGDTGSDDDDGSDGSRPINFDPIVSNEPTVKPPPVEHGSSQAGMTTAKPAFKELGRCKAAILVCCQDMSNQEKEECFSNYGCRKTYSLGQACHPRIVKQVIEEFAETYAPINNT